VSGWIAIDGGQSEVRVRLSGQGRDVLRGPGFVHGPGPVGRIVAAVQEALDGTTVPQGATVGVGHTGFPSRDADKLDLCLALGDLLDAAEVRAAPDWVTAHLGALGGGPGVVLAVGTGAVCLGTTGSGPSIAVGGWGPVFGDAGSAFWIGRAGLEAALRHDDGRASTPDLHREARQVFGPDLHVATAELYAAPDLVDRVAHFAPSVVGVARSGDPIAKDIVRRAVEAHVEMVVTAAGRLPVDHALPVSYAGGVLREAGHLVGLLRSELGRCLPGSRLLAPAGDALSGAVLLATTDSHPFEDLVVSTTRSTS